jgi:hypothetical protein
MNPQRTLSQHRAHLSVRQDGASRGEGLWQDKNRNLLGGWMAQKAKENSLRIKGAWAAITFLRATIRWEHCEMYNLPVGAP